MASLRSAPRQAIVRIDRVGPWGRVEYHHVLGCGHVEVRKRASRAPVVACGGCVLAETHQARRLGPEAGSTNTEVGEFVDYDAEQVTLELQGAVATARLATFVGVDTDDVEVRMSPDGGSILAFVVHVTPEALTRLTNQ